MNVRREVILREMGLGPRWRLRAGGATEPDEAENGCLAESGHEPGSSEPAIEPPTAMAGVARTPAVVQRPQGEVERPVPEPVVLKPSVPPVDSGAVGTMDWDTLTQTILACKACRLCEQRQQAVPGVGDRQADWLFVGEGPGAEEDLRGEPFVGKAGQLLDAMLAAIGIERGKKVYIANTVKCRPPRNRTPETAEMAACFPYLARQIDLIRPRLIVALGRPAAQSLLNTEIRIASARGKCFDYHGIPVVVTYHPAYLLRNPMDKAKAWEDLCFARREMARLTGGENS